jgi:hypothetical protein
MHLSILLAASLFGGAVVTNWAGRYPINRRLRWKGELTAVRKDTIPSVVEAKAVYLGRRQSLVPAE